MVVVLVASSGGRDSPAGRIFDSEAVIDEKSAHLGCYPQSAPDFKDLKTLVDQLRLQDDHRAYTPLGCSVLSFRGNLLGVQMCL